MQAVVACNATAPRVCTLVLFILVSGSSAYRNCSSYGYSSKIIVLQVLITVPRVGQLTAGNTKVKGKRSVPATAREIPISCRVQPSPPAQGEIRYTFYHCYFDGYFCVG